jgi:5-methylcytosine-specific restriction protein A
MKLRTLKPAISMVGSRIAMLDRRPGATERTRGSAWMKTRERWLRAHPLCVECERQGRASAATQLDHIIPLGDGGSDDESNYQGLCEPCHKAKTAEENSARVRYR